MKRNWKLRAKRWLIKNNIINGYNGLDSDSQNYLIEELAKIFERIYNE